MNLLPLLSVILGLISIIITINYIKYYDKLNYNFNKISSNCIPNHKRLDSLVEIQDQLDISDYELNNRIQKNKKKIKNLLTQKETFENYVDHKQRGLKNFKFSGLIN